MSNEREITKIHKTITKEIDNIFSKYNYGKVDIYNFIQFYEVYILGKIGEQNADKIR